MWLYWYKWLYFSVMMLIFHLIYFTNVVDSALLCWTSGQLNQNEWVNDTTWVTMIVLIAMMILCWPCKLVRQCWTLNTKVVVSYSVVLLIVTITIVQEENPVRKVESHPSVNVYLLLMFTFPRKRALCQVSEVDCQVSYRVGGWMGGNGKKMVMAPM